ncbi:MAG TPA: hypothetical protein VMH82_05435, partial [Myxococcota bacterium]|nr:hypothetical protein [Myxococcota bacterium]
GREHEAESLENVGRLQIVALPPGTAPDDLVGSCVEIEGALEPAAFASNFTAVLLEARKIRVVDSAVGGCEMLEPRAATKP